MQVIASKWRIVLVTAFYAPYKQLQKQLTQHASYSLLLSTVNDELGMEYDFVAYLKLAYSYFGLFEDVNLEIITWRVQKI
ncbi:hypothetical protein QE152_g42 [Popillia japonica]|uniref:Uncharacterized protein n=1 Tax=Popillia japonica TaxID=7064 RepID=A0AAW1NMY9_POPJA